jgi:hypothetical protein
MPRGVFFGEIHSTAASCGELTAKRDYIWKGGEHHGEKERKERKEIKKS